MARGWRCLGEDRGALVRERASWGRVGGAVVCGGSVLGMRRAGPLMRSGSKG